jgi:hypothetical protein
MFFLAVLAHLKHDEYDSALTRGNQGKSGIK